MLSVGLLPELVRLDRLKRTWPPPPRTEVTPELSEIIEEAEDREEPATLRDTQDDLTAGEKTPVSEIKFSYPGYYNY